jgi:short/branched chain acyl-CoA dehydrogenase
MISKTLRASSRTLLSRQLGVATHVRAISTSPIARVEELTREAIDTPLSLWNFTEEENMIRETGRSSPRS